MILIDDTPDFYQNTLNYPKNPPCRNMDMLFSNLKGKLIVLEGIDGSGKTTQRKKIAKFLRDVQFNVKECSFKQSAILHHSILKGKWENYDPYTGTLLYLASITDTLSHEVLPAMKNGEIVLLDRYIYSLYARAIIRNVHKDFVRVLSCLRKPDIILYFDTDETIAMERKYVKREDDLSYWEAGGDLELSDNRIENWLMYQKRIRSIYQNIFRNTNNTFLINGNQSKDEVYVQIKEIIQTKLIDI